MKLNLDRPLIVFDLETTGLNIGHDRIIQLGYIKVMPDGSELSGCYWIDPEMEIPQEAIDTHHITMDVLREHGAQPFKAVAAEVAALFEGCDIAGYNSNRFDYPMLVDEFLRVGVRFSFANTRRIDVQEIFYEKEPRTLTAAYKFYCNKVFDENAPAHDASNDAQATLEVLKAQLDHYDDLDNNVDALANVRKKDKNHAEPVDLVGRIVRKNGQVVFNFGKYKDQPVAEVFRREPSYFTWIREGDFPRTTKMVCEREYLKSRQL